jgi:S-DNA-T family DNA segregation ATPase FtsK/SpoIIIE
MSDYRISESGRILPGGMETEIHRLPMRLTGAALLAMAAVGWLSLMSWSIGDPSLNQATGGEPSNLLGATGASLADVLLQVFGLAAIALFLPPAVWGLSLWSGERVDNPRHRLAMWSLSLMLIASALSMLPKPQGWLLAHGLGGVIGDLGKSVFMGLAGLIHDKVALPLGGTVAGALGLFTLLRACAIRQQELVSLVRRPPGSGRGLMRSLVSGASFVLYAVGSVRHGIAGAMVRRRPPAAKRQPVPAYWGPEDRDRFNPGQDRRGSFNPRFVGYDIPDEPTMPMRARAVRQTPRRISHTPPQLAKVEDPSRIEPYFDSHRAIPRRQVEREPVQPVVRRLDAAALHPRQPVQRIVEEPRAPQRPTYVEEPFAEDDQDLYGAEPEDIAYDDADADVYDEVDEPAPAPIYRGSRAAPAQPAMPDRSAATGLRAPKQQARLAPEVFSMPPLKLLTPAPPRQNDPEMSDSALGRRAEMLQSVLEDFRIKGQITGVHPGPVITLYEFEPARGTKSSRVIGLADDIARSMSAVSARVAVIPGRDAIGIELPNHNREVVYLRQLLEAKDFAEGKGRLQLALGKTIGGDPVIVDLARMPHLLIAGTTGSGKSVAINTMILSLLYRLSPEDCRFIMIDPKMLELSVYDGIPHLLTPVVTDPHQAIKALKWTVAEMNSRYERMCKLGVRNIMGFNQKVARAERTGEPLARTVQTGFDEENGAPIYERENIDPTPMPYIVVVIDEMADLMMVAGKDIEHAVQRLSQMARAAGIHLIMATQRPSVDVITGTIKANFPSRISFQVTSKIDSRTILGEMGAEQLLGAGDMLTMAAGGRIMRAHGPFVSDDEVESVVGFLRAQGEPDYLPGVLEDAAELDDDDAGDGAARGSSGDDVYDQAIDVVLRDRRPTTSYLQRRLGIGYNRAASLIERMEADGIISAPNRTGKREVLGPEPA